MSQPPPQPPPISILPLATFSPDLYTRAWQSTPHPYLPLIATTHDKTVTVFSLSTFTKHSSLTGGHSRSIRSCAWQPFSSPSSSQTLRLVTGSFDSTAGIWTYNPTTALEKAISSNPTHTEPQEQEEEEEEEEWEFTLVLEGHENEVKSLSFSPSGQFLATCSRDKSIWIWEHLGGEGEEEDWETVAVLSEHDGDVKTVAFAPVFEQGKKRDGRGYGVDCLVSGSYDDTVRVWREDGDGEWGCVSVLTGHEGTVWGVEWERQERQGGRYQRLMTAGAEGRVLVWELKEEEEGDDGDEEGGGNRWGGIPNTMRRSLREEWEVKGELPRVHTREIYSVAWSGETGLVATVGGDGMVVVYQEDLGTGEWRVLGRVEGAHGPYEVNHVVWCRRFDKGGREGEEMLVTTGDDGVVRAWEVRLGE
ncbi:putative cytosolic iron-sulfur protein assembly protein 1 [Triangularia verruculosa]|uniref:Probable cytosolic iron-sulfur protein assembly protein 1 n=1 Tax=Triangularia verruculosa TaxID=2587418 RepID=A0AAN6XSA7_9PEZI|nr:putative cytosolic iron-sulfur protein assembly protein 1 [Triangularia verruculosa]